MVWVVFLVFNILKFTLFWFIVDVVAIVLSSVNIVGYVRCRKDWKEKAKEYAIKG